MRASPTAPTRTSGRQRVIPKSLPSDLIRGWEPLFGKDHAQTNKLERDGDSKKSHPNLVIANGRAAIDRDGRALNMPRALGAQEQGERGDVFDLADAPDAALRQRRRPQLLDRLAGCGRPLRQ